MTKTLDSNQTRKVDRPYTRPIYLIHLTGTWQYAGSWSPTGVYVIPSWYYSNAFVDNAVNPVSAGRYSRDPVSGCVGKHIYNGYERTDWGFGEGNDNWLTDRGGVLPGDQFQLSEYPAAWGTVKYVLSKYHVVLDSDYTGSVVFPYIGGYLFKRTTTLYFSDINFTYNGIDYEDYLFDLSRIEDEIQTLGGYANATITLRFKNEKIRDKNYLIELLDDYPVEGQYLEIYKLYHDRGEVYGADVSTKLFKGVMGQPYDITDFDFKVDCSSMLFSKDKKLPLDVITNADYPKADPDVIGKYRNIIYGDNKKVICPWTYAGWASTLTADITDSATSIIVSEAPTGVSAPFTVVVDTEQLRVGSMSDTLLTISARGYDGTTAVQHSKGAIIYEKLAYFQAEVAQHPVKSIGDVFVKRTPNDEWLRVTEGYTAYISDGGRSYISFTDKVKYAQEIHISAETTPNEGSHTHGISSTAQSIETEITVYPTGSAGPYGHSRIMDGNTDSYCALGPYVAVEATFNHEQDRGNIIYEYIWIYKNDTGTTGYVNVSGLPIEVSIGPGAGWYKLYATGVSWRASVSVTGGPYGSQIGEIYKIIHYYPYLDTLIAEDHPATGIDVEVTLSGNSAANVVIGDIISCDVEGYADDSSGTYTGTASALIERPDHVRKHILCALLGFDITTDIDTSFATVGTTYQTRVGGYKFAFVLHEIAVEAMDLFQKMDFQTRSNMFESGGQFNLHFNTTTLPTSVMTFDRDNIKGFFNFSKTEIADICNFTRGYYYRDYSRSGSLGEKYANVIEVSNNDSVLRFGTIIQDVEFSCLKYDKSLMVDDVLDWIIEEKKDVKKIVSFEAFWDATKIEPCDYFYIKTNFWNDTLYKTIRWADNFADGTIFISGLEYPTTKFRIVVTYHQHTCTSPLLVEYVAAGEYIAKPNNTTHAQSCTSPVVADRIGIPANATHTLTTTVPSIVYFGTLTVQSGNIATSATTVLLDYWDPTGTPELLPYPETYLKLTSTSPTLTEH